MTFMMQTHAPLGSDWGHEVLPVDSALSIHEEATLKIHVALAREHSDRVYETTGMRMATTGYGGTPFSKDQFMKTIRAGGVIKGWQDEKASAEKEAGGEFFPDSRDEMGKYAESIGIDFDKFEAACSARSARVLYPEDKDVRLGKDGMLECTGRRTAMNNTDQADALAIHYLAQFQFQVSHGGRCEDAIGESVEIPAGRATLEIKRMGPAQFYRQGHLTTEMYQNVPAITPPVTKQTWTPGKIMTSIWATEEFNEDIIQAWMPTMERAIAIGRGIARDHMMLRGHTATGAGLNINAYGGTRTLGSKDPRLNHNGFMGANWDGTLNGGPAGTAFKGVALDGARANLNMVPAMRASLNKYGLDAGPLRLIIGPTIRAQFVQDAKARPDTYQLLMTIKDGEVYMVDGVIVICLADSQVTDANTAGMPDYTSWNSEGNPINLTEAGVYDGTAGLFTCATLVHRGNWLEARKRAFNVQAVKLPLADQIAIVGSERYDIKPIWDDISVSVASGISVAL